MGKQQCEIFGVLAYNPELGYHELYELEERLAAGPARRSGRLWRGSYRLLGHGRCVAVPVRAGVVRHSDLAGCERCGDPAAHRGRHGAVCGRGPPFVRREGVLHRAQRLARGAGGYDGQVLPGIAPLPGPADGGWRTMANRRCTAGDGRQIHGGRERAVSPGNRLLGADVGRRTFSDVWRILDDARWMTGLGRLAGPSRFSSACGLTPPHPTY